MNIVIPHGDTFYNDGPDSRPTLYVPPEQAIDLDSALGTLPAVSRAVVWLHDVEGYTHKEIGSLLGKSESFSKIHHRAHNRPRMNHVVRKCDFGGFYFRPEGQSKIHPSP